MTGAVGVERGHRDQQGALRPGHQTGQAGQGHEGLQVLPGTGRPGGGGVQESGVRSGDGGSGWCGVAHEG